MLYNIRSNPMYPSCGAVPVCRLLSLSLYLHWAISLTMFNGVRLAGFKKGSKLLYWPKLPYNFFVFGFHFFSFPSVSSFCVVLVNSKNVFFLIIIMCGYHLHFCMITSRTTLGKETNEEDRFSRENVKIFKAGTKCVNCSSN